MSEIIPNEWKLKNLSSIAILKGRIGWRGYTTADLRENGPLALGAGNISKDNKLDLTERVHLSQEKFDESPDIMAKVKDILIVQRGSLGKIALIDRNIGNATINPSMILVKEIKINPKFLYYYLCGDKIQKEIKDCLSQTGVPMISQEQCKNFEIILPDNEEQQKIASILENVDNNIDKTQEIIEKYEMMKQGLEMDLFSEISLKTDFISFSEKEYVKLITKGTTPTTYGYPFVESGINFIKVESIDSIGNFIFENFQYVDEPTNTYLKRSQLKENDILFSIAGAIGRCAVVKEDILPANINQALALIRLKENVNVDYVKYVLDSFIIQDWIKKTTVQLAQANLSLTDISNFSIPYPEIEKQEKLVKVLKSIDNKILSEQKTLNKLQKLKTGLMQDLLTGKVRVKT